MKDEIMKNLVVIAIVIGILLGAVLIFKKIFGKILDSLFAISERSAKRYAKRIAFRYTNITFEIIVLVLGVATIYSMNVLMIVAYTVITIVLGDFSREIRAYVSEPPSLLNFITKIDTEKNYIFNRIRLISKQYVGFTLLMFTIFLSFAFLTELKWPDGAYFGMVLITPIWCNLWLYFYSKKRDEIMIRRGIVYLAVGIMVSLDVFTKFQSKYGFAKTFDEDITYIVYTSGVLLISIERIMKVISDDYENFKKKLKEDVEKTEKDMHIG